MYAYIDVHMYIYIHIYLIYIHLCRYAPIPTYAAGPGPFPKCLDFCDAQIYVHLNSALFLLRS